MGRRDKSRKLLGFARRLRSEMTDAERRIWKVLRDRRLQGFKFRRQVPIVGYIVYCINLKLVVELDGGQHSDSQAIEYDERRTKALEEIGIRVLRFWDDDVLKHTDIVAEAIYDACWANPHPGPLPDYRERG
jgi:very-short-patch-repair endonuclease